MSGFVATVNNSLGSIYIKNSSYNGTLLGLNNVAGFVGYMWMSDVFVESSIIAAGYINGS